MKAPEHIHFTETDRILVIEDDFGVRTSLAGILRGEGYEIATAKNGHEGLLYLQMNEAPHLILLDLMMPVMDGRAFRAQQLQDPALAAIPTLILSAARNGKEEARALAVHGYVKKPLDLDELLETVRYHVPSHRE